ncbi:MAG: type II secretion system F family protein, partial [Alicyclobacillus sp.]|nr:type II secretion system F family protein [Alicyclobacillus sp.]
LPLLISATDGALRQLLERAYQRMQTTDTLADALTWMAQETGLAEMRQLASVWIQAGRYEGTSLETQLEQMAVDERAQFLFNLEKRAERKKMSVLFEAIAFIALPTIFLVGILILMRAWSAYEHMSGF